MEINKLSTTEMIKASLFLNSYSMFKIPLIFFCKPRVIELNEKSCAIKIPLNRKTKNHLNSMYFGTLSVGADCAGGLAAMSVIQKEKLPVSLVFKDFKANFLKRAMKDVVFRTTEVEGIKFLVHEANDCGERVEMPIHIDAYENGNFEEKVAEFILTLSLKKKVKK